jgi:RNA polymerase sigma-70 factor (ECF subfamily)
MYRVSCNTAKNTLAAQAKKIYEGLDPMEAENFLTANFLQDVDSPENETVTEELINLIQAGIRNLPEELKQAITYREFHCMSYEEIANAMDCPIGTVRSRIFRARDALDKIIKTAF